MGAIKEQIMNHLDRMKEEHKELSIKINALNAFIHGAETFKALSDLEQVRMIKQSGLMEAYASVLGSRIWVAPGPSLPTGKDG
jgi:hypothetical protein